MQRSDPRARRRSSVPPQASVALTCALALGACRGADAPAPPAAAHPSQARPAGPAPAAPTAAPTSTEEACAQIVLASYAGAAHAPRGVTRDKAAAKRRAEDLLAKARGGGDFAALAKTNSDAPSSAPGGGYLGAFIAQDWPKIHEPIRDTIFGLPIGSVAAAVVEAPYGYVIVRRCAIERAASRHILVRYAGAKNAGPDVKRTKAEAVALAAELQRKVTSGADFGELARASSEDVSAERGGEIGAHARGRLSAGYEAALFALRDGEISVVVESEHGYHVIQRLPLPPGPAQ